MTYREVDPVRHYDSNPLNPCNAPDELPITKWYISDFPFQAHQGEITNSEEKLLDKHIDLLDRYYDDEAHFIQALHTLADDFRLTASGVGYSECGYTEQHFTISPKVDVR